MKRYMLGFIIVLALVTVIPISAQGPEEIPYGELSADIEVELANTVSGAGTTPSTGMIGKTIKWEISTFDFPLAELLAEEDSPVTITGDLEGSEIYATWLREYEDIYYVQGGIQLGNDITFTIDETEMPPEAPESISEITIPAGMGMSLPFPLFYMNNLTRFFEVMEDIDSEESVAYGAMQDDGDMVAVLAGLLPTAVLPPKLDPVASEPAVQELLNMINETISVEDAIFDSDVTTTNGLNVVATISDPSETNQIQITLNWDDAMDGLLTEASFTGTGDMNDDGIVESWESIDLTLTYASGYDGTAVNLPVTTSTTGTYTISKMNIDYTATEDWNDLLQEEVQPGQTAKDMLDSYITLIESMQGHELVDYQVTSTDGMFYGLNVDFTPPELVGSEGDESPPDGMIVVNGYDGQIFVNMSNMYREEYADNWYIYHSGPTTWEIANFYPGDFNEIVGIWVSTDYDYSLHPNEQLGTAINLQGYEYNETTGILTINTTTDITMDNLVIVLPPFENPVGDFSIYLPLLYTMESEMMLPMSSGMSMMQTPSLLVGLSNPQAIIPGPARADFFHAEKTYNAINTLIQAELPPLMDWVEATIKAQAGHDTNGIPGFLEEEFGLNFEMGMEFDDAENRMSSSMFMGMTMAMEANEENEMPNDVEINARMEMEAYMDWTDVGIFENMGTTMHMELLTGKIVPGNEPPSSTGDLNPGGEEPAFSPSFEVLTVIGAGLLLPIIKKKRK